VTFYPPTVDIHRGDQQWDYEEADAQLRILVTGSRDSQDESTFDQDVRRWIAENAEGREVVIIHGGARGLDMIADEWANANGVALERHGADWFKHGKTAGPIRNQEMVDSGADVCLAYPLVLGSPSGTMDCMIKAYCAGIPVYVRGVPWTP